jgi:hypothetical protein
MVGSFRGVLLFVKNAQVVLLLRAAPIAAAGGAMRRG